MAEILHEPRAGIATHSMNVHGLRCQRSSQ
jgi:hypothetical protein